MLVSRAISPVPSPHWPISKIRDSGITLLITGPDRHASRTLSASLLCSSPVPVFDATVYGARPALSEPLRGVTSLMCVTGRKATLNEGDYLCRGQGGKEDRTIPNSGILAKHSPVSPHVVSKPSYIKSSKPTDSSVIGAPRCW